jgi:hypothetical protein
MSRLLVFALTLATLIATPPLAAGQGLVGLILGNGTVTSGAPTQVLSANPFGLATEFYNAEYEIRVADGLTTGAGASRRGWYLFGESESPRLNGDVFVRYYPGGRAFNGIALGLKAGATRLPSERTLPGVGFDLNHSYAFTDHVVMSTGLGMKRLLGRDRAAYDPAVIATFRLNVGLGF